MVQDRGTEPNLAEEYCNVLIIKCFFLGQKHYSNSWGKHNANLQAVQAFQTLSTKAHKIK